MIKQAINQIRLWGRIVVLLYPLNVSIYFGWMLIKLNQYHGLALPTLTPLTPFTLSMMLALFLFLPFAWDTQKRWIMWGVQRINRFPTTQRIVAIVLVVASLSINFVGMNAFGADALATYVAIGYVSAFVGIGK